MRLIPVRNSQSDLAEVSELIKVVRSTYIHIHIHLYVYTYIHTKIYTVHIYCEQSYSVSICCSIITFT